MTHWPRRLVQGIRVTAQYDGYRCAVAAGIQMAVIRPAPDLVRTALLLALPSLLWLAGCAFDIVHVKQLPASYTVAATPAAGFVLTHEIKATLGTTFPTRLKAGTRWRQVGNIEYGAVFATQDQIVKVEASNIYEAQLVVSNNFINGFYLPVEKTFAPVTKPIRIETIPLEPNQP